MVAFVTGGTGFVGSHLVEALLAGGHTVRTLVRRDPKWLAGLPVELVRGDLRDAAALRAGVDGADVVVHAAALTRAPREAALWEANVEGARALLDAAAEAGAAVGRIVLVSSQAAAGPSGAQPLDETAPLRPLSGYGRSKAAMERMAAAHAVAGRTVVVRPPSVYGPREADIYTVVRTAARTRLFPVVGDARRPSLSLVHVADLTAGILRTMEAPGVEGETFFLAGPREYSWEEIRRAVADALGHGVLRVPVPVGLVAPVGAVVEAAGRLVGRYPPLNREKAREARETWLVSSEKARRVLGYAPAVELDEGMRQTVGWYRASGWL